MEKKYYLLTFNEELSCGTPVPAIACFNEEHMNIWLNAPSGHLRDDYDEAFARWTEDKARRETLIEEHKKQGVWGVPIHTLTAEQRQWKAKNWIPFVSKHPPYRVTTNIAVHLNMDDDLASVLSQYYLMAEMVAGKIVEVQEVDEAFYHTFNKSRLFRLSMCDIFEQGVGYDPYGKTEKPFIDIEPPDTDEDYYDDDEEDVNF